MLNITLFSTGFIPPTGGCLVFLPSTVPWDHYFLWKIGASFRLLLAFWKVSQLPTVRSSISRCRSASSPQKRLRATPFWPLRFDLAFLVTFFNQRKKCGSSGFFFASKETSIFAVKIFTSGGHLPNVRSQRGCQFRFTETRREQPSELFCAKPSSRGRIDVTGVIS